MSEREIVRIQVLSLHISSGGYDWPETLDKLISKLAEARDSVPVEYRDAIKVEADSDSYDPGPGWVDIFYDRPETDEELAKRLDQERCYAKGEEARERQQYERLKKKFE